MSRKTGRRDAEPQRFHVHVRSLLLVTTEQARDQARAQRAHRHCEGARGRLVHRDDPDHERLSEEPRPDAEARHLPVVRMACGSDAVTVQGSPAAGHVWLKWMPAYTNARGSQTKRLGAHAFAPLALAS